MAAFSLDGKVPVDRDSFTMSVITGARTGSKSRSSAVGTGSREQVAFDDFVTISVTSETVAGVNNCNFDEEKRVSSHWVDI